MNMKSDRVAMKGRRAVRTLLAGLFLTVSISSWAASPLELIPSEMPPAGLEPAELASPPQWPEETLQLEDSAMLDERIALSEEAWDISERPAARLSRPIKDAYRFCRSCEFHVGVGGTYHSFENTAGMVIPMTVTWDRSRWEFGVFRFASSQISSDNQEHFDQLIARPYWAASLSRRFQLNDRGPLRAFFGFGVSYKTEQDILSVTHWNFSSQLGLRFHADGFPATFEISARHWSNGGVKTPNRGQDFAMFMIRFDH
ncbi:MAG: acyloxyacyl hydrolase [Pseudomonadota bacterium]